MRTLPLVGALSMACLAGCARDRAALEVSVTSPVVIPFIVHGNCFITWLIEFDATVGETRGVDVVVQSMSFRVEDSAGRRLSESTIDADVLREALPGSGAQWRGQAAHTRAISRNLGGFVESPPTRDRGVSIGESVPSAGHVGPRASD